jgi:hypothetical protein
MNKSKPKQGQLAWLDRYFYSGLLPFFVFVTTLVLVPIVIIGVVGTGSTLLLGTLLSLYKITVVVAVVGIVAATVWNFAQGRTALGLVNLCGLLLSGTLLALATYLPDMVLDLTLGQSEDHFADNLTLPEGIEIKRPLRESPFLSLEIEAGRYTTPTFELRKGVQPGIYYAEIWDNPGEPGHFYLRAFEVTRGSSLSRDRLMEKSVRAGWSDDGAEQFFSSMEFTLYEGDHGDRYAARIEVWFVPDSGQPVRKINEGTWMVEGWQH